MTVLVVTCACEGGYYSPEKNPSAPIRIYSDRRVQDDIFSRLELKRGSRRKWLERLSRKEYRRVRKAAANNRLMGIV